MAITALTGMAPEWYTPPQDDNGDQTAFEITPLNGICYTTVIAMMASPDDGNAIEMTESRIQYVLDHGLTNWRNFNVDDKPVVFSKSSFGMIPSLTISHIVNEIMTRSQLSDEQKKT